MDYRTDLLHYAAKARHRRIMQYAVKAFFISNILVNPL